MPDPSSITELVVEQTTQPPATRHLPFPVGSRVRMKNVPNKVGTVIGWFDEVAITRWHFDTKRAANCVAVRFDDDIEKLLGLHHFELELISA